MLEHAPRYIHYGSDHFNSTYCVPRINSHWKPSGLWASPENSDISWKTFCEANKFRTDKLNKHFTFELKPDSKILHLYTIEDAEEYLIPECPNYYHLDVNKLYNEFDGIELHISEDHYRFYNNNVFNTWDVDSICIWNLDVVSVVDS